MKIHTASLVRYTEDADHWISQDGFRKGEGTWFEYSIKSRHLGRAARFSILYVGPDGEARREHGGPILPGPYAPMIAQASVISAHKIERPTEVVELEEGDMVILNGTAMMLIDDNHMKYPELVTPDVFAQRMLAAQARKAATQK